MPSPIRLRLALVVALLALPLVLAWVDSARGARTATVIVKYRPGVVAVRSPSGAHVIGVVGAVRGTGARVLRVRGSAAVAARRLARSPDVVYAEPNMRMRALDAPDDPLWSQQPDMALIHALDGWDAAGLAAYPATGGAPVGIVDTGIDARHEDLRGKVAACAHSTDGVVRAGSCSDNNGHGTHVAGTIGALANNGAGIAGMAFDSPLIVCKALGGAEGSGTVADVASCIAWARDQGARVISMSLGGPGTNTLRAAVKAAWARGGADGALLVAAAGNDGAREVEYPAAYPEVISVAAVDDGGRHASFSNFNSDVELAAPGVDVLSARRGGGYVRMSGTSMATPHVAGVAAIVRQQDQTATADAIRDRLDAVAVDLGPPGRDPRYGFGLADLLEAAKGAVE